MKRAPLILLVFLATASIPRAAIAEPSVSFEIVNSRGYGYEGSSNNYYIIEGILKNTGTTNVENIYVRGKIFWESGTERGTDESNADMEILRPGETSPFDTWVNYCCPELIDHYTIDVVGTETTREPYRDVQVVNESSIVRRSNEYFYGEVLNAGNRSIDRSGFRLYVIFYDATGRIVDYDNIGLGGHLASGSKVPFNVGVSLFDSATSHDYWIRAKPLEQGLYPVDLAVDVAGTTRDQYDRWVAHGTITNNSDVTVTEYKTYIVFRSEQDEIMSYSVETHYEWDTSPIPPRTTQQFEHPMWSDPPEGYEYFEAFALTEQTTSTAPPSPTPSLTSTPTNTMPPTLTPTATQTPTITPTGTPTSTPTESPYSQFAYLPYVSRYPAPSPTPTNTPMPTSTSSPTSTPTPTAPPTSTPEPRWVEIVYEGFEGEFPTGLWYTRQDSESGSYVWGPRDCNPHRGNMSAWAVGAGADGAALPCGSDYPDETETQLIYGPFDLSDATAARMTFWSWSNTQYESDTIYWGASTTSALFWGQRDSGTNTEWRQRELDFSNVSSFAESMLGEPEVWIMLAFETDEWSNRESGWFIDDVRIEKRVGGSLNSPETQEPAQPGVRKRVIVNRDD